MTKPFTDYEIRDLKLYEALRGVLPAIMILKAAFDGISHHFEMTEEAVEFIKRSIAQISLKAVFDMNSGLLEKEPDDVFKFMDKLTVFITDLCDELAENAQDGKVCFDIQIPGAFTKHIYTLFDNKINNLPKD